MTKTRKRAAMPISYDLIRKRAKAMEKDTARFLCDLVRTQSFSSREKNVIAVIKKEMQAIGFDGIRIDGLGNIIGRIGKGRRVIAFDGHVDTVYPGDLSQWKFDPFKPFVKSG
ncbi:MAG: YgeY family selenium metabolism-linked hydrolase, partial [Chthoniobacterales bacterium]